MEAEGVVGVNADAATSTASSTPAREVASTSTASCTPSSTPARSGVCVRDAGGPTSLPGCVRVLDDDRGEEEEGDGGDGDIDEAGEPCIFDEDWSWGLQTIDPRDQQSPTRPREWSVRGFDNELICPGDGVPRLPMQYIKAAFPMQHFVNVVKWTNKVLKRKRMKETDLDELIRWIGVVYAISFNEFGRRSELWSTCDVVSAFRTPELGRFMACNRFETLHRYWQWSQDPDETTEIPPCGDARWLKVSGLIDAVNSHKEATITPGMHLCLDEGFSRWGGSGGSWIELGLPHYIGIDGEPKSGAEFWMMNDCDSRVCLRLEFVPCKEECDNRKYENDYPHGTAVAMRMTEPWKGTGRHVFGDSNVASVNTAIVLLSCLGLYFTGKVKTATALYPKKTLSRVSMDPVPGSSKTMLSKQGGVNLLAGVWVDRKRKYFISSCGSTVEDSISRVRWRQTESGAQRLTLTAPIPKFVRDFFNNCDVCDRHNRARQDTLDLEKKFAVKTWDARLVTSILSLLGVDAFYMYERAQTHTFQDGSRIDHAGNKVMEQKEFLKKATMLMLTYGSTRQRRRSDAELPSATEAPQEMESTHVMVPCKRTLPGGDVVVRQRRKRQRCRECHRNTAISCSKCKRPFCGPMQSGNCLSSHVCREDD